MFSLLTARLPLLASKGGAIANTNSDGSVISGGDNPFTGLMHIIGQYASPIQEFCYAAAILACLVTFLIMMFANSRVREQCKSKLLWIVVGVIGVTSVGYLVGYTRAQSARQFASTIIPTLSMWKSYLSTVMPNALAHISDLWPL